VKKRKQKKTLIICSGAMAVSTWRNPHRRNLEAPLLAPDGSGRPVSRVFQGEAADGSISLDRAIAWHDAQGPGWLLLAHERARADFADTRLTGRVYEVVRGDVFLERYTARRRIAMMGASAPGHLQPPMACDRFLCEVARGPCRLFFDLEFATAFNVGLDGDALQRDLLAACARSLAGLQPPVTCTAVCTLDSSKPAKFSRHVIVTLDDDKTLFADPRHAGAFVASLEGFSVRGKGDDDDDDAFRVPFADPAVYHGRQPFRLYAAAKAAEPLRYLLPPGDPPRGEWNTWDPDLATLRSSLVTLRELPDPGKPPVRLLRIAGVTGQSAARPVKRTRQSGAAAATLPPTAMASHDAEALPKFLMRTVPSISAASPRTWRMPEPGVLFISCDSRDCATAGRTHNSNQVYAHVDLLTGRYRMACRSESCRKLRKPPWQALPPDALEAVRRWLLDGGCQPPRVGASAAAALF